MDTQRRVLVVEDDRDTRSLYVHWLGMSGFEVFQASDGAEGVERARTTRPNVVLMDVAMPRMDGLEATRRLRRQPETASVPVVILSAYSTVKDRQRAFDAGADEFLAKPCDLDLLIATLQHYSGR